MQELKTFFESCFFLFYEFQQYLTAVYHFWNDSSWILLNSSSESVSHNWGLTCTSIICWECQFQSPSNKNWGLSRYCKTGLLFFKWQLAHKEEMNHLHPNRLSISSIFISLTPKIHLKTCCQGEVHPGGYSTAHYKHRKCFKTATVTLQSHNSTTIHVWEPHKIHLKTLLVGFPFFVATLIYFSSFHQTQLFWSSSVLPPNYFLPTSFPYLLVLYACSGKSSFFVNSLIYLSFGLI